MTCLYCIFCIIASILMTSIGYGFMTWQYWVIIACICGAYTVGIFKDN